MSAAILPSQFYTVDALAIEDFEDIPTGPIETLPGVTGGGGAVIEESTFFTR